MGGIHGWGLFARRDIEQGEFLIEYRGDRIRPHVANEREAQYRREGKDMYLFSLSNEWIVDATDCGSAARFVNHSCAPSTMSKIVTWTASHTSFSWRAALCRQARSLLTTTV